MNAWWQMWEGGASDDLCKQIIRDGMELPVSTGTVGHGGVAVVNPQIRRSKVRWVPRSWAWMFRELEYYFHTANVNAFGFDLSCLREVQFTEYREADQGEYKMHEDNTWLNPRPLDRKLSLVMQLCDPATYAGCDLVLGESPPDPQKLRAKGTVIVFPSFLKHAVTPITQGVRFSLVAWFDGPKFR